jgi:hypothetical protein
MGATVSELSPKPICAKNNNLFACQAINVLFEKQYTRGVRKRSTDALCVTPIVSGVDVAAD